MEDYGVAKGYIELDTKNLESNVKSAVKALDDLERKGALAESELNKLESQSNETGNAFQQAQTRAKELTLQIEHAQKQCGLYESEIKALNTVIEQSKKKQAEEAENIKKVTAEKEKAEQKEKSLSAAYKAAVKEIGTATKKYGENSQEVQDLTAKHDKLIKSYENTVKKVRENENALTQSKNKWESYGIEIEQSGNKITEFQTKLNNTQASISRMSTELAQAQSKTAQWGEYLEGVSGKLNGWGNLLSLGVTAPVLAAGTAIGKMAIDSENSLAQLQGQLGLTADESKRLQEIAQNVYENGYGESLGACISDMAILRQNIRESADWTSEMTQNTLQQVETITALFNTNADEVTRTAQVMKSSGLIENISDGLDIITYGFQNGANYSGELLDTLREYSPQFVKLGMDGDEAMQYLIQGAQNGAWNLDKVGDALKELSIRVVDGSDTTVQGFEAAGLSADEMAQKFAAGGDSAKQAFQETLEGLAGIEDPVQRNIAGVNLFGTMWEDLGESVILSLADVEGGLANIEGATDRAGQSLNNTFSTRAISLGREFLNSLLPLGEVLLDLGEDALPVVHDGAEMLTDILENLDEETAQNIVRAAGFAAALGPVAKVAGTATKGISTLTNGFGKLLEKAGTAKKVGDVAETVADVGTQAVSTTSKLGGFSGILSKIGSPFGIAAIAATAVIGIGAAIKKAKKDAEEADLEKHFGDIELSAEEVEDIAERLTTTDWTMRVDAVIDAKDKLEELQSDIESTIQTMEKAEWKIGVGLELTEEEKGEYKQSVTDYVSGVQSYIEQQQYTASLAVDAIFEPGSAMNSNFQQSSSEFYNALNGELTALGEELAELVNQAWEDDVLSEEELQLIDEKRAEIQKKLDEIAQAQYDLELDSLKADATKDGLSADSFKNLEEQLNKKLDEEDERIEESKRNLLLEYQIQYNNGEISLEEFEEKKKAVDFYADQQFGELVIDNVNLEIGTIKDNYSDKIGDSMNDFSEQINRGLETAGQGMEVNWTQIWNDLITGMRDGSETLNGAARSNVENYLETMKPQVSQLEEIAQSYKEAGQLVPENINQGLMDYYQLEAMTGNTDHMWELIAGQVAQSPELQNAVEAAAESGMTIPEELSTTLQENYGLVYNAATGMFQEIIPNTEQVDGVKAQLNAAGIQVSDGVINALAAKAPDVQAQTINLLSQMQNGTTLTAPQIQSVMSACGFSIGDSLAGALATKSPEVQLQAVNLLNQLRTAEGAQRDGILSELSGLGIEFGDTLSQGVSNSSGTVQTAASGTIDSMGAATRNRIAYITPGFTNALNTMGNKGVSGMERTVASSTLDAPDMKTPNWDPEALSGRNGMQTVLDENPLSITVNVKKGSTDGIPGFAYGGIATEPSIFGEDGPEMAIPLSQEKRTRALALYEKTGELLGVTAQESAIRREMLSNFAASYRVESGYRGGDIILNTPGIDYDMLANKVAEKMAAVMKNTPVQPIIEMKDGDVYLENERVGRKVAPVVSRIISQNT